MLTSTYALVAFSVEQAELRKDLQLCRAHARANFHQDRGAAAAAEAVLEQLHRRCQWRKIERYLIPVLRQANRLADALLRELEEMAARAAALLAALQARLAATGARAEAASWLHELCRTMEQYCDAQLERLAREEAALFPLARKTVGRDAWFAMARQIMQDERTQAGARPGDRQRPAGASHGPSPAARYERRAAPYVAWPDPHDAGLAPVLA